MELIIFTITSDATSLRLIVQQNGINKCEVDAGGNFIVTGGGGLGYGAGSGGTVTQATSKSTAVTLNKPTGQIIMNNASLAAGASLGFSFFNSILSANDTLLVTGSGAPSGSYSIEARYMVNGACVIVVTNITTASLSDAVVINFAIIKGATA